MVKVRREGWEREVCAQQCGQIILAVFGRHIKILSVGALMQVTVTKDNVT